MNLILGLYKNHLFWEKSYWIPLANFTGLKSISKFVDYVIRETLIQSQLIENPTKSNAGTISLNADATFRLKIIKNLYFGKGNS